MKTENSPDALDMLISINDHPVSYTHLDVYKRKTLINHLLPTVTDEMKAQLVADLGQLLLSQGITAICDMGNMDPSDNYPICLLYTSRCV